jgi:hypothetical protein
MPVSPSASFYAGDSFDIDRARFASGACCACAREINSVRLGVTMKYRPSITLLAVMLFSLTAPLARGAELVMFERAGCPWCAVFDREIAPIYGKTDEGRRAPLRRLDIDAPLPPDLGFIDVERLTPLFVLVDKGREIGRIRGYPGEDHFWGLLRMLIEQSEETPGAGPG